MTIRRTPSFPNEEETRLASVRLNIIFNAHSIAAVSTKWATKNRTYATINDINDNGRQAKMISEAVAATLMTMGA